MSKRGLDFLTTLHGYDAKFVSEEMSVETGSENLTQQHLGPEADVNTIVRRFGVTRARPSGPAGGVYGDFSGIDDYDSALAAVERAQGGFLALPADIRERFGNDAGVYLEYVDGLTDEELERAFPARPPAPGTAPAPAPAPVGAP